MVWFALDRPGIPWFWTGRQKTEDRGRRSATTRRKEGTANHANHANLRQQAGAGGREPRGREPRSAVVPQSRRPAGLMSRRFPAHRTLVLSSWNL